MRPRNRLEPDAIVLGFLSLVMNLLHVNTLSPEYCHLVSHSFLQSIHIKRFSFHNGFNSVKKIINTFSTSLNIAIYGTFYHTLAIGLIAFMADNLSPGTSCIDCNLN